MAFFFDNYSLKSALEYMADPLVATIEGLSVNAVQMPHAHGKIAVGRLNQEMVVVVHEAISMTNPVESINSTFKQQQKGLPVTSAPILWTAGGNPVRNTDEKITP